MPCVPVCAHQLLGGLQPLRPNFDCQRVVARHCQSLDRYRTNVHITASSSCHHGTQHDAACTVLRTTRGSSDEAADTGALAPAPPRRRERSLVASSLGRPIAESVRMVERCVRAVGRLRVRVFLQFSGGEETCRTLLANTSLARAGSG